MLKGTGFNREAENNLLACMNDLCFIWLAFFGPDPHKVRIKLLRGMRANIKIRLKVHTVEDSLQLAAGFFNLYFT